MSIPSIAELQAREKSIVEAGQTVYGQVIAEASSLAEIHNVPFVTALQMERAALTAAIDLIDRRIVGEGRTP